MPVVPSLTSSEQIHEGIVGSHIRCVVGSIAPEVSGGIDQKGNMQDDAVSKSPGYIHAVPIVLTPAIMGHLGRKEPNNVKGKPWIALVLETNQGIFPQVGRVDIFLGFQSIWMFLQQ